MTNENATDDERLVDAIVDLSEKRLRLLAESFEALADDYQHHAMLRHDANLSRIAAAYEHCANAVRKLVGDPPTYD